MLHLKTIILIIIKTTDTLGFSLLFDRHGEICLKKKKEKKRMKHCRGRFQRLLVLLVDLTVFDIYFIMPFTGHLAIACACVEPY